MIKQLLSVFCIMINASQNKPAIKKVPSIDKKATSGSQTKTQTNANQSATTVKKITPSIQITTTPTPSSNPPIATKQVNLGTSPRSEWIKK